MKHTMPLLILLVVVVSSPIFAQEKERPRASDPFQRLFTLPGIEFSEDQQAKVAEIRQAFTPKIAEIQEQWNAIITAEQEQARREAFRTAREDGKEGQALRQAVEDAVKLTPAQLKQQNELQRDRNVLLNEIRTQSIALLSDEQKTNVRQPRQGQTGVAPTHADVKYGPHQRNVMDVWLADSDKPAPVLVSIHGGGFRGGNKSVQPELLRQCLDSGISVVAITYRLSDQAIAPAQFHDAARAIQYIRHHATDWKIDPKRIAATGGSAGAGLSLWLGFHEDLADPDNEDPVLKESTRLTCMSVYNGQTSYDPRFIRDLFPGTDTYQHSALALLYDVDLKKLDELPEEKYKLFEETSALPHLTKDDPPAQLFYGTDMDTPITNQGVGIHHPRFGKVLKEKMDELGIECQVHTRSSRNGQGASTIEFVKKHFGME